MNLIRLPQKLQDYVILHELVHTKHKNHSKKFWKEMDRYVEDGKRLRREVGRYRLGRYLQNSISIPKNPILFPKNT